MFEVRNIRTGEIKTVYAVCGIMFLFYNGYEWYCDYMAEFEPVDN